MIVKSKNPEYVGFVTDPKSKEFHTTIVVDGYEYGERILEGVKFVVSVSNGFLSVETREDCKNYMEELNEKKWLTFILTEIENSGNCIDEEHEDVGLLRKDGTLVNEVKQKPVPINVLKKSDIFNR